jgi:hypothetical protein
MSFLSAVAGSFISNFFDRQAADKASDRAASAADVNRAWLEDMSSTAHQREMLDLEKAGLNPILGISGSGSVTPGSSAANVFKADPSSASAAGVSSALSVKRMKAELDLMDQQKFKTMAEWRKFNTEADVNQKLEKKLDYDTSQAASAAQVARNQALLSDINTVIESSKFGKFMKVLSKLGPVGNIGVGALGGFSAKQVGSYLKAVGATKQFNRFMGVK